MGKKHRSRTGEKYNSLTTLNIFNIKKYPSGATSYIYNFKCDCGEEITTDFNSVKNGLTKSCGCKVLFRVRPNSEAAAWNRLYADHARDRHKNNGCLDFNIWKDLVQKNCVFCGEEPPLRARHNYKTGRSYFQVKAHGVDRIDSSKGYTIENVQPCCAECNIHKMDYSDAQYISKCNQVSIYQKQINKDDWRLDCIY